jgi:MFS family permease
MDESVRVGMFGGVVGRLVRDATAPGTAFTGFILGVILLASGFVCRMVQADVLGQLFGQIVMAAALARFALNGYSGEYRGTILSTAGGTWPQTLMVAGRYLTLQLMWVVPVFFVGWSVLASALRPETNSVAVNGGTGGGAGLLPILGVFTSGAFLWSIGLLFFGMLLLPPVFLIVAVRAEKFEHIFSPAVWGATFGGRLGDLYTLYAVQAGGTMMGMVVMAPLVLLGYSAGSGIGLLALVVAMGFLAGLAVTLMGRLCGFFAFGEESPVPSSGLHDSSAGPAGRRAIAAFPGGAAGEAASGEAPEEESTLPPLPDAAGRAADARRRFETDREGAIADLEAVCQQHAPSPDILHALALMLHAAGRIEAGAGVARDAIALGLRRGQAALAAEVFAAYWKQSNALGVGGEQIDVLATTLFKSGHVGQATTAFGVALNLDHGDRRAIKGLLQIADHRLHREAKPKDAARIYTFLLQYAGSTPFAEDMKRGLAEAEARLKRAV